MLEMCHQCKRENSGYVLLSSIKSHVKWGLALDFLLNLYAAGVSYAKNIEPQYFWNLLVHLKLWILML